MDSKRDIEEELSNKFNIKILIDELGPWSNQTSKKIIALLERLRSEQYPQQYSRDFINKLMGYFEAQICRADISKKHIAEIRKTGVQLLVDLMKYYDQSFFWELAAKEQDKPIEKRLLATPADWKDFIDEERVKKICQESYWLNISSAWDKLSINEIISKIQLPHQTIFVVGKHCYPKDAKQIDAEISRLQEVFEMNFLSLHPLGQFVKQDPDVVASLLIKLQIIKIEFLTEYLFCHYNPPNLRARIIHELQGLCKSQEPWDKDLLEAFCKLCERHAHLFDNAQLVHFYQDALRHGEPDIAIRLVHALFNKESVSAKAEPIRIWPALLGAILTQENLLKIACYQLFMGVQTDPTIKSLQDLANKHGKDFLKLLDTPVVTLLLEQADKNPQVKDEISEIYYRAWLLAENESKEKIEFYFKQTVHYMLCQLRSEDPFPQTALDRAACMHQSLDGLDLSELLTDVPRGPLEDMMPAIRIIQDYHAHAQQDQKKIAVRIEKQEAELKFKEAHESSIKQDLIYLRKHKTRQALLELIGRTQQAHPEQAQNALWMLIKWWEKLELKNDEAQVIAELLKSKFEKEQKDMAPLTAALAFLYFEKPIVKKQLSEAVCEALLECSLVQFDTLPETIQVRAAKASVALIRSRALILKHMEEAQVERLFALNGCVRADNIKLLAQCDSHFPIRRRFYVERMGDDKHQTHYAECKTIEDLVQKAGLIKIRNFEIFELLNDSYDAVDLSYYRWKMQLCRPFEELERSTSFIRGFRHVLRESQYFGGSLFLNPNFRHPDKGLLMHMLAKDHEILALLAQESKEEELQNNLKLRHMELAQYWIVKYLHFGVDEEKSLAAARTTEKLSFENATQQIRDEAIVRTILAALDKKFFTNHHVWKSEAEILLNVLFSRSDSEAYLQGQITWIRDQTSPKPSYRYLRKQDIYAFVERMFADVEGPLIKSQLSLQEQAWVLAAWFDAAREEESRPYYAEAIRAVIETMIKQKAESIDTLLTAYLRFCVCRHAVSPSEGFMKWFFGDPVIFNFIVNCIKHNTLDPADMVGVIKKIPGYMMNNYLGAVVKALVTGNAEAKVSAQKNPVTNPDKAGIKILNGGQLPYCRFIEECLKQGIPNQILMPTILNVFFIYADSSQIDAVYNVLYRTEFLFDEQHINFMCKYGRPESVINWLITRSRVGSITADVCLLTQNTRLSTALVTPLKNQYENDRDSKQRFDAILSRVQWLETLKTKKAIECKLDLDEVFCAHGSMCYPLPESKDKNIYQNKDFTRLHVIYRCISSAADAKSEPWTQQIKESAWEGFKVLLISKDYSSQIELLDQARNSEMFAPIDAGPALHRKVDRIGKQMYAAYKAVSLHTQKDPYITPDGMYHYPHLRAFFRIKCIGIRAEIGMLAYSGVNNKEKEAMLAKQLSIYLAIENKLNRLVNRLEFGSFFTIIDDLQRDAEKPIFDLLEDLKTWYRDITPHPRCLVM